jgi:hypothetical protein
MADNIFYVYQYLNEDGQPYYSARAAKISATLKRYFAERKANKLMQEHNNG